MAEKTVPADIPELVSQLRNRIAEAARELVFDEIPHKYFFRGNELKSVSEVCKQFAREFDERAAAERVAQKTGVPADEILKNWRKKSTDACSRGTGLHAYGELCFYQKTGFPVPAELQNLAQKIARGEFKKSPRERAVDEVWEFLGNEFSSAKYVPVAAENRVMNLELGYAGTFDLLALEILKTGEIGLVIFDYKTNENLFNIFKNRDGIVEPMRAPIAHFVDCSAAHYSCQLALYQLALQKIVPEIPISRRVLLWINPPAVNLIDENSRERYSASPGKWRFFDSRVNEISELKQMYRFRSRASFGTLALPDISREIADFLGNTDFTD